MRPGPRVCPKIFTEHLLCTGYKDKQIENFIQKERHHRDTQVPDAVLRVGIEYTHSACSRLRGPQTHPHSLLQQPIRLCAAPRLIPTSLGNLEGKNPD